MKHKPPKLKIVNTKEQMKQKHKGTDETKGKTEHMGHKQERTYETQTRKNR